MKVKKINASSKRTAEIIKEAFAKLLNEKKELNQITVTELVKVAGITRSSFYTHYDNIYDVAKEIQDDTIDLFLNDCEFDHLQDVYNYIDDMILYLKDNERTYRMLLSSNDTIFFFEKIRKSFVEKLYNMLSKSEFNNDNLIIDVEFFLDGLLNILINYFRSNNDKYTLDDIGNRVKDWLKLLFFNR